jgi:hypothetical protein
LRLPGIQRAVNAVVTDRLALRAAGMSLDRDGYIENKAAEVIPGLPAAGNLGRWMDEELCVAGEGDSPTESAPTG